MIAFKRTLRDIRIGDILPDFDIAPSMPPRIWEVVSKTLNEIGGITILTQSVGYDGFLWEVEIKGVESDVFTVYAPRAEKTTINTKTIKT
jgi:hypothetical protein